METRREAITDDWQEVESAASIVSLPASDDDDLYDWSRLMSPVLPPHQNPADQAGPSIDLRTAQASPNTSKWPSARSPMPGQEPAESTPGPREYHKACCAAIESIDGVVHLADELGGSRVSTLSLLQSTCRGLSIQTHELERILHAYAGKWLERGSNMNTAVATPLHPEVFDWIHHLQTKLGHVKAELRKLKSAGDASSWTDLPFDATEMPLRANMTLADCLVSLENSQAVLAEFLPILNAQDLDIHQKPPRRQAPHPTIRRIRQELYNLKDRIRELWVLLVDMQIPDTSISPLFNVRVLLQSLGTVIEAISTILTNHGSEWIESDLADPPPKTISYTQFLKLDPDILHDVAGHLDKLRQELDIEDEALSRSYSREMIQAHQAFLLGEGGQQDKMQGTFDFLKSLLTNEP
ncbi:hypothetical protein FZEAL_2682 [Fusarium zealandicum]|uniref:Uncharacterized protein n=1 Tax=Fusarium zealandicum TaxID=1053134 RepID=A0A8H4UR15_9HYPO|nr:hypothetical protein FZEAL_2682 [Fusarium zealandicum]